MALIINLEQTRNMEVVLSKLESLESYKDLLKVWCRRNDVKVNFLVDMTLSKSKSISSKLVKTYSKNFSNFQFKWLENELKLFHFCLLAVSAISQIQIQKFGHQQYALVFSAFPNKHVHLLEYEAINFVANKNIHKKKWEPQEDALLTQIITQNQQSLKWNELAVELFIKSNRNSFRTSKQCRERWVNHLDSSIKHQKWSDEEDKKLIQNVLIEGKKWSQIMRKFENARTEHMIKNRFISLILKFKKAYSLVEDEDELVQKMAVDMGIDLDTEQQIKREEVEKKLRHKPIKIQSEKSNENPVKQEFIEEKQVHGNNENFPISQRSPFHVPQQSFPEDNSMMHQKNMIQNVATPTFISPIAFIDCNSFASNLAYFQYYLSCFQSEQ